MRLEGRTALVTGGASGFGAGIARAFRGAGAEVMIADVNGEAVEAMAGVLGASWTAADVAEAASVACMAAAALGALGHVDILVNSAAAAHPPAPLEEVGEEAFEQVFRVNAKSVFLTARAFLPGMKARGRGVVLNIASTAGISPWPGLGWYSASRGWMIAATKSMAVELAPFGIRVNALCPAGETPLLKSLPGEDTPENRARFLAAIPLGRLPAPKDLGHAAVYLCSDEAALLTGVALELDGGRCL